MKKIIIILGILMCFNLTGCADAYSRPNNYEDDSHLDTSNEPNEYYSYSHLMLIEGENDLYYYSTTHIVYIIFDKGFGQYGYMAPYYSENGRLCVYDTEKKEIIELEE